MDDSLMVDDIVLYMEDRYVDEVERRCFYGERQLACDWHQALQMNATIRISPGAIIEINCSAKKNMSDINKWCEMQVEMGQNNDNDDASPYQIMINVQ